jgi:hypothetical protein
MTYAMMNRPTDWTPLERQQARKLKLRLMRDRCRRPPVAGRVCIVSVDSARPAGRVLDCEHQSFPAGTSLLSSIRMGAVRILADTLGVGVFRSFGLAADGLRPARWFETGFADVEGTPDLIVYTTPTAVEAHAHQCHAQTDDGDDTEDGEATNGAHVVVDGVKA